MNILVVDDEKDMEMLFRQKFRKEVRSGDIHFEFAFSGNEALEILRSKNPPDVVYIFSDINMPGMSGLKLLDKVKDEFPKIVVSMISAYGDDENYQKAIASGASEFFTKPVDFNSLKEEITRILKDYRSNN